MIRIRRAEERGHFDHGWLDTSHTFSFGDYHDPAHMGFRSLRVINEDRVRPGRGFPTHGHRDMEIITYVVAGALEHRDSMGNGSVIRPGDVQRMSAGTGVTHSEFNQSKTEPVHFLQIWILPARPGQPPGYEQKSFPACDGRLQLVASPDGRDGSVTVHQDARVLLTNLGAGVAVEHRLAPGRHAWVQVVSGGVYANDQALDAGDGAALSDEPAVTLVAREEGTQALVFDLA
jgi:quercetin 2,3-dioxygenase